MKSTWTLRYLSGLAGVRVLLSVEEGLGPSVSDRLSRLGIHDDSLVIVGRATVDQLVSICRTAKARTLAIDSVQRSLFSASDLRHLIVALDLNVLVAVSQVNSHGEAAGRREFVHESDVVLELDAGVWSATKSRFFTTGLSGCVLEGQR